MKRIDVGGQAVIEGVMMKTKMHVVTSVRKPKGKIVTKKEKLKKRPKYWNWPLVRGVVNLLDILILGIKTLMWSAEQQEEKEEEKQGNFAIFGTLAFAFVFVIAIFVALPYFLTGIIGIKETSKPILFNIVDGIIRILFFVAYVYLISLMKDIRRLFQYHGAEHKSIHCFEAGKKLTVENAKKFTTLHPRCGTSFLVIVLIISIFVFSLLPVIVVKLVPEFMAIVLWKRKVILFFLRILMIPIIAGVSYEALKLSAKFSENPIMAALTKPGLWLQKITTREPDKKQIEVALVSLKGAVSLESGKSQAKNI